MVNLFRAELRRFTILLLRYPLNFFSGLVVLLITFFALVTGAQYIAGPGAQFGSELDSLIIGYWLWTMAITAVNGTASAIQIEARAGILEQIYLSAFGPLRIFLTRALVSLGFNIISAALLLGIMLWLTGRTLLFPLLVVIPFTALVIACYGLGMIMGGLAILYKQIGRFLTLFQFLLLFLVLVPVEEWAAPNVYFAYLMPIAPAAGVMRDLMSRGLPLELQSTSIAIANALIYFVAGVLVFRQADRAARRLGLLGQY